MGKEPRNAGVAAEVGPLQTEADHLGCEPADDSMEESVEDCIERDASLVPREASALLVEPAVLDPAEIAALLADLEPCLAEAVLAPAASATSGPTFLFA